MADVKPKPGDVVQLKTGGYKMVVESIAADIATCLYNANQDPSFEKAGVLGEPTRVKLGVATLKVLESA